MYTRREWISENRIGVEIYWQGKYGSKGEKRAKRRKATSQEQERVNQRRKEKKIERLIDANFYPNDLWVTLKYAQGTRKPYEEVKKDFEKFIRRMRSDYKKRGEEFKFIYRIEIGPRGGAHIHILLNRIMWVELLVQKNWVTDLVNLTPCQDDLSGLAKYIAKALPEDEEEGGQLSMLTKEEKKKYKPYGRSRNLVDPEPSVKEYSKRTVRKLVEDGPKARDGYYIDKNSIETGINPFTGQSYMFYAELAIKPTLRKVRVLPEFKEQQSKRRKQKE